MKKEKLLFFSLIVLLLMNLALLGFIFLKDNKNHHEGRGNEKHHGVGPKQYIIEKLEFNEEQINQYEAIIPEHKSNMDSLGKCLKDAKKELYSSVVKTDYPEKEMVLNRVALLHRQIDSLNFAHFTKIKAICKAKQKIKFDALSKELSELFGPRRKK